MSSRSMKSSPWPIWPHGRGILLIPLRLRIMAKKKGGPDHGRRLAKHPQRRDSLSGETAFDNLFAHAVALVGSEERARAMLEAALSSSNCRGSQRAREEVEQV